MSHFLSWRWMQIILGIASLVAFGLVYIWLPETMHPGLAGYEKDVHRSPKRSVGLVVLNPLKSLKLLMSPVVLISVTVNVFRYTLN